MKETFEQLEFMSWNAPSSADAIAEYTSDEEGKLSIASAIYPASQIQPKLKETDFHKENQSKFIKKFPYSQKIRGDGGCYLNAFLVGLLNKCVNNQEYWNQFKINVGNLELETSDKNEVLRILDEIEDKAKIINTNTGLDRHKLNTMLQHKGNENLGTMLLKAILVPDHKKISDAYELKILNASEELSHETSSRIAINIAYKEKIDKAIGASDSDFAESYEESVLLPYARKLSKSIINSSEPVQTFDRAYVNSGWINDLDLTFDGLYLINLHGSSHFDLLYAINDPICAEIDPLLKENTRIKEYRDGENNSEIQELIKAIGAFILTNNTSLNTLINEIRDGREIQHLDIETLKFIKEIHESSTPEAQASKTRAKEASNKTETDKSTPILQDKSDALGFYHLCFEEINKNDKPSDNFSNYFLKSMPADNGQRDLALFVAMMGKTNFIVPMIGIWPKCFTVKDNFLQYDNTPLMWAIANAKNEFANTLLNSVNESRTQLDINFISSRFKNTALHIAIAKDYKNEDSDGSFVSIPNHILVKTLIAKGANPNIPTKNQFSALDIAVLRGSSEMVSAILESKMLISDTVISAIKHLENLPKIAPINTLLKEICHPIREVSTEDFTEENKNKIKDLLTAKLKILDPNYGERLALQKLISDTRIREKNLSVSNATIRDLVMKPKIISVKEIPLALIINPDSSTPAFPPNPSTTSTPPLATSPNFSFFCNKDQRIITFIIKSGPEGSGENLVGSSGGVGKFDYKKQLSAEETYNKDNYNEKLERDNILDLLRKASNVTQNKFQGLDDNFFIAVMKVASENCGISRIEEAKFNTFFDRALKKIDPNLDATKYKPQEGDTLHKIAKYFSANFQELSRENKYLTARPGVPENTINPVGRRLFRVCTEENIKEFEKKLKSPSSSPASPRLKVVPVEVVTGKAPD